MAYNSLLLVTLKAFVVLISAQAALGTPVGGLLIDGAEVRASHGSMSLCDQCTVEMRLIFYLFRESSNSQFRSPG